MPPKPPEHTKWKPGQSGNPSGRPKGFARIIREETKDGRELVLNALAKLRDPEDKHHWAAQEWLTDRGFGKAASYPPVEGGDPLELGDVERTIVDLVDQLAARREAKTPGPAENGKVAAPGATGATPA